MSHTVKASPSLIPDIKAFDERVAIHIHEGGITTNQAEDLAAQAQGLCPEETVGVGISESRKDRPVLLGTGWYKFIFYQRNRAN